MKKGKNIGFELDKINTEQFAILEENYSEGSEIKFRFQVEFRFDDELETIGCFAEFTFSQQDRPFLKIEVCCHFGLEEGNWSNFLSAEKTTLTFPKKFMAHLAAITVGTTRGILYAKTEGTQFSSFIAPFVDTNEVIKEDVAFERE